jgi:hypothetical protein
MLIICIVEKKVSSRTSPFPQESTRLAATTFILLAGALVFGKMFAVSKIPTALATSS